jgi:hypothetical protein
VLADAASARMVGMHWPGCSDSRYLVALPTTPSACVMIRRCAGLSAARRLRPVRFAEPDGALRNAMARGTREPFSSRRLVRPVDRSCARSKAASGIVLEMESSVSLTRGEQENSVWNGHYACTCYRLLFVFNQFGDLERKRVVVPSITARKHAKVDAAAVLDVRRQRGAAPTSPARLQPPQLPAHAGDAGADQELVTDKLEGQAKRSARTS